MKITDYKKRKEEDAKNGTENVKVLLVNGRPALQFKQYSPDTGELLNDLGEGGLDVIALRKEVETRKIEIENINELIEDAEALTGE